MKPDNDMPSSSEIDESESEIDRGSLVIDRSRRNRIDAMAGVVIIVFFLAGVGLPVLDMFFGFDRSPTEEKRKLAPMPAVIAALRGGENGEPAGFKQFPRNLKSAPREFKAYVADHFGFRNMMIRQHASLSVNLLGVSPTPDVVLGEYDHGTYDEPGGQWLYYAGCRAMDHYRGVDLFAKTELDQWRAVLEQRRHWLAQMGVRYAPVIAPNKHSIYPEHLPDVFNRVDGRTRTDQLVEYLREHTEIEVIDTRSALWRAREKEPRVRLYHRYDTHWNDLGAFAAYQEIARRWSRWRPSIQPLTLDGFDLERREFRGGDMISLMGVPGTFRELRPILKRRAPGEPPVRHERPGEPIRTGTGRPDDPRLLMFYDSFGHRLIPFLSVHCDSALFVSGDIFDASEVIAHKPDIVLSELIERKFMSEPPELDPELEGAERENSENAQGTVQTRSADSEAK